MARVEKERVLTKNDLILWLYRILGINKYHL